VPCASARGFVISRRGAGDAEEESFYAGTYGVNGSPNFSATALCVTWPAWMLMAFAKPASMAAAPARPRRAICRTYGNVTLHRAYVLVRPTAPGMFVKQ